MEGFIYKHFLDQRKLSVHIVLLVFSVLFVSGIIVLKSDYKSVRIYADALILIFIQIELFIFIGSRIFSGLPPGMGRKKFSGIILTRWGIFYVTCFILAFLIIVIFLYAKEIISRGVTAGILKNFFRFHFSEWFKSTASGLSAGTVIFLFLQWQDALNREQRLREQNLIFQNETLKSQVNPHFLFNSLNTLSALISTKPEMADWFINRLSSIYRYILENGQKDKLPLKDELAFISDYYDLHRVRDEGKILLETDTPDADNYFILPVSLQILVENAIKHNMATRDNPLKIRIYIEGQHIVVKNNLQKMASKLNSTSTGLKNLTERLKLSTGKTLIVDATNDYFIVKLPLLK